MYLDGSDVGLELLSIPREVGRDLAALVPHTTCRDQRSKISQPKIKDQRSINVPMTGSPAWYHSATYWSALSPARVSSDLAEYGNEPKVPYPEVPQTLTLTLTQTTVPLAPNSLVQRLDHLSRGPRVAGTEIGPFVEHDTNDGLGRQLGAYWAPKDQRSTTVSWYRTPGTGTLVPPPGTTQLTRNWVVLP